MEFTFDSFYGQIGEDDKFVRDGQVLYSENVDLTSNTDFVTISPKPTLLKTTPAQPTNMYFLERGVNQIIFSDAKDNIYLGDTLKYVCTNGVKAFWSNSKYLYWISNTHDIYRILITDISGDWNFVGKVTMTDNALEDSVGKCFVVEGENNCFLGYGTKLYEIDLATGQISNQFTFIYDEIIGMMDLRDVIEVAQKDGVVFSWDRVSDSASSYKIGVKAGVINQSSDQKVLIGEGSVYIVSGGGLNKVAGAYTSDVLQRNKFKFSNFENTNIGYLKQVLFLGSDKINYIKDSDSFCEFGNANVVNIGSIKSGLPVGLSKYINTSSGGSRYKEIYGVIASSSDFSGVNDTLYIAYRNESLAYGIDTVDLHSQNYNTGLEGLLILPNFDGGNKSVEKKLNKLKFRVDFGVSGAHNTPAGDFYIYKVVNGDLVPLNGTRDMSKVSYTEGYGLKELVCGGQSFFDVPLVIFMKQSASRPKNNALKFYSVTLDYEPIGR